MPAANSAAPSSAADSTDSLVVLGKHEATESSYWEFINQSNVDSDTGSLHSVENGFLSWNSLTAPPRPGSPNPDEEIGAEPVVDGGFVLDAAELAEASVEMEDDCSNNEEEIDDEDVSTASVNWR